MKLPPNSKKVIRSAYSPRDSVNVPLSGEPSPVKQEFKKEVNINTIVDRMKKGIQPPPWMTSNTPRYGDFTNMPSSFTEAHNIIEEGKKAFYSLPLEFRRALDHDPRNLDHAPRELYEQFGLLKDKKSAGASPDPTEGHGSPPLADDHPKGDISPKGPAGPKNAAKKAAQNADE